MMGSHHCNNKLPSREDVTGVIVKGGVMAKITNADKLRMIRKNNVEQMRWKRLTLLRYDC